MHFCGVFLLPPRKTIIFELECSEGHAPDCIKKPNAKVMMMGTREENLVWSQRLYVTTLCYSHIVDWLQSSNVADPTLHTDTHHLK